MKRCYHLGKRGAVFGLDWQQIGVTALAFGAAHEITNNIVASIGVALSAALVTRLTFAGRLPGAFAALRRYLQWPAYHPATGRERYIAFPPLPGQEQHHAG